MNLDIEYLCKATGLPEDSFFDPEEELALQALSFAGVDFDSLSLDERCWLISYLIVVEKMTTSEIADKLHTNNRVIRSYRTKNTTKVWLMVLSMDQINTSTSKELLALQKYHQQCENRLAEVTNRKDAQISSLLDSLKTTYDQLDRVHSECRTLRRRLDGLVS